MINFGKHPILGVNISAVDYAYTIHSIVEAARSSAPLAVTALAVHGAMTGFFDRVHRRRLNGIDLVVPDGQPVRWALRWIHGINLADRVRGSDLTLKVLEAVAAEGLPVYFYGSTSETLSLLVRKHLERFPKLVVAGAEPSKFRKLTHPEKLELIQRIQSSHARLLFVGLGCPRQEVWIYEYRGHLRMPLIAVGAAFPFQAGLLGEAPRWMQAAGLEWLYRLGQEPARLWKRYLMLNPIYLVFTLLEALSIRRVPVIMPDGNEPEESYG